MLAVPRRHVRREAPLVLRKPRALLPLMGRQVVQGTEAAGVPVAHEPAELLLLKEKGLINYFDIQVT